MTVYEDADKFLMIYGAGDNKASARAARSQQLRDRLRSASPTFLDLRNVQTFLNIYYKRVAGTNLTGADGLDMDEASAAQLYRDIDKHFRRKP